MIAELQTAITNTPRRKAIEHRLSASDRVKIRAERMALLMRGAPVAIGVSVVNAIITLVVAWDSIERALLLVWAGLVVSLAAVRFGFWARLSARKASAHALAAFARLHVVGMAANGVLWGALAPIFALHGLLGNAFLPFMIAGMTAAAIASAGASWRAVLAFNAPALAPFAAAYAVTEGAMGIAIAAIVCLYAVATAYLAWTTQQMVTRSIWLRSRNDRLLDAMKKQADAAHESEKRYRALVESTQDVTIIFSPEGRIAYVSPSAAALFGAPAHTLLDQTTKDIVHPDDLEHFRSIGAKSLSRLGEVMALPHVCLKAADGTYVPLTGRLTNMLYVPGVEGFVLCGGRVDPLKGGYLHAAE